MTEGSDRTDSPAIRRLFDLAAEAREHHAAADLAALGHTLLALEAHARHLRVLAQTRLAESVKPS